MKLFNIMLLVNSMIFLVLGGVIYFRRREHLLNRIWGLLCVVFFFWASSLFKGISTTSQPYSLMWFRIANLLLIFLPVLFLHSILVFLEEQVSLKKVLLVCYTLATTIFVLATLLPETFIHSVTSKLSFHYYPEAGRLYILFIAMFALMAGYGFYKLVKRFLGVNDFRCNQARYLFIGWLFGLSGVASFFPLSLGVPIYPIGNYFIILFAMITTYAIAKYHLMDIDVAISRATLFAYFVGFTLLAHTGLVYVLSKKIGMDYMISSALSGGVIMLLLLFLVHYQAGLKLSNRIDNIVYEARNDYRDVVEQMDKLTAGSLDFDGIMNGVVMILSNNLGIEKISILLIDRYRVAYTIKVSHGLQREVASNFILPLTSQLVGWLKEKCNIFSQENFKEGLAKERFRVVAKDLEGLEAKFSIPIFYKKELVGMLNLSDKKGGNTLTQEEINIINNLVQQVAVHIKNALLYEDSITDALTRLYHHEYFYHRLNDEIVRAKRYLRPLALLMVDVDRFKDYNTKYGHQAGDRALKEVAYLLRSSIRKVDVVARYGGEEFCVIAPETSKTGAKCLAERLRDIIAEKTKPLKQREIALRQLPKSSIKKGLPAVDKGITVSIGVSTLEGSEQEIDRHQFIKKADEALYKAKEQGGDKVVVL